MSLIISKFGTLPNNKKIWKPPASCLHWYKFEDDSTDFIGSADGTDTNISYIAGKIDKAADFNGSNAGILVDAIMSAAQLDGDFEVNFWIKINSAPVSSDVAILTFYKYRNAAFNISAGTTKIYFVANTVETGSLSIGTYYNISGKRDTSGNREIWVNNVLIDSTPNGAFGSVSYHSSIGARNLGSYDRFADITMDSLMVFVPFLTNNQRTDIFNAGIGR